MLVIVANTACLHQSVFIAIIFTVIWSMSKTSTTMSSSVRELGYFHIEIYIVHINHFPFIILGCLNFVHRLECSEFYFRFIKRELNVYPYKHYRLDTGFDQVENHCFRNCHHFFCFPSVHWLLISRLRDRIFWHSVFLNERA